MKRLTIALWVVVLAAVTSPTFGAIVYSGSQNVILSVDPMSPMDSQTIQIGGMAGDWDDFTVELWLDMGMPGMMAMGTRLAIYAPGSMVGDMGMGMGMDMGMGMGGILGMRGLAMGGSVAADSFFDVFFDITLPDSSGEFGEDGGYIGLRTAMGQYGWLHLVADTQRVVFDGWAYEDQPGIPVAAGQGATCDWVRGRPHKMHWPQLPDLSFTGIDISLSRTTLGDDFKCTATGPISDIHIWGSFQDDILPKEGPESLTLELSIYSDVPATKDTWSQPGKLLWTRVFKPGEYAARRVHDGPEDWYDPGTGLYLPTNHKNAFQYNFCIKEDAFTQQQGTIYWLVVRDLSTNNNYAFGWKTTSPRYHWNDDAVYLADSASNSAAWREMTYPKGHSYEGHTLDLAFVITGDDKAKPEHDLGDAPDSSNSIAGATMLAYPSGVNAHFPTVYQAGSPPHGPLHRRPRDMYFLGEAVSLETEADLGPDEDLVNNLDPLNDAADQDGADDGLRLPAVMPLCQRTTLDYTVTVTNSTAKGAYVNVWCDWNRDGDWDDLMLCPDGDVVPEWAVQNDKPSFSGVGVYTFTTSPFKCWHPVKDRIDPIWVRITIAEQEHLPSILIPGAAPGIEGTGPKDGYEYGETEDYYLRPQGEPTPLPVKYDWGDAPVFAAAAGYPTLEANDGARHVPIGPWLGDAADMPDSEPDGQPHPNALGDDISATSDENGASVPPLVQGHLAAATIQVNGGGGIVQAWIDFNGDRAWQAAEKIFDGFLPDGVHPIPFSVPAAAAPGQTFARFRISRKGGLAPTGAARDGEVEDHEVSIEAPPVDADVGKLWCQLPDLTPNGIDVRMDRSDNRSRALADDFECKSTGKLVNIRFWGSWNNDRRGEIKRLHVRIHPDDPVGPVGPDTKNPYSKPCPEILWEKDFFPGQFEEKLYHVVRPNGEWWWDPVSGKGTPGGDTQVWQIDMKVNPDEAFVQEGTPEKPRIYWLAIEAETAEGEFGWKTRQWPEHFMDDAVWDVSPTTPRLWNELRYPPGHRYFEHEKNSIDLSFCLMFATTTPPPATMQPVAITTCPPTETTCPALRTTCPIMETQCPPALTKCPIEPTKCPETLTRCPPTATQCQVVQTQCPVVETECSLEATKCPVYPTRCPESLTKCPPTATQCQVVETQCPPLETECALEPTKCPIEPTRCPESLTKCPPTATQCQTVRTQCPPVETACPPEDTKCPPLETQCPPVDTKCPLASTKCPEYLTRCPPTLTQCQVVQTQCPALKTYCPPSDTQCPPLQTKCPAVLTRCPEDRTKCPPCVIGALDSGMGGYAATGIQCPPVETTCLTIGDYLRIAQATK